MFPSVSLEEQRLGWPALWSVNHTLVSRKEIFRACSLLPSPSIHPSIHPQVVAPNPGWSPSPQALCRCRLPPSGWGIGFYFTLFCPLPCGSSSHVLAWKASCKTCPRKLKLDGLFAPRLRGVSLPWLFARPLGLGFWAVEVGACRLSGFICCFVPFGMCLLFLVRLLRSKPQAAVGLPKPLSHGLRYTDVSREAFLRKHGYIWF